MKKINSIFRFFDSDRRLIFLLSTIFIASRFVLAVLGFTFGMDFLNTAWQTVDTWLLRTDLARSIWYLHSQPPLFNLFIGIGLKFFPIHYALFFEIVYHFLGLILGICLFRIIKHLTNSKQLSFWCSLFFVLSPSMLLFEYFFFYDFAVVVILVVTVFLFQKAAITNETKNWLLFFLAAAFLVLTRRIFHLIWFVVALAIVLYFYRVDWKRIVLAALFPLLLIVFWYGKNLYYFGNFDASSWTGMGFFKTAGYSLNDEGREKLYQDGIVSKNIFYATNPFGIPVSASTSTVIDKRVLSVPVVGEYMKKEGGINYNYYAYIDLSRQLKEEFISIIKHRPLIYLRGTIVTSIIFFAPASNYFAASENNNVIDVNYEIIKTWDNFVNRFIFLQPLAWGGEWAQNYLATTLHIKKTQAWRLLSPGIFILVGYLISIFYALKMVCKKKVDSGFSVAARITVLFLVINIIYVCAVGILAEAGENQRHRFMVEPLVFVILVLFVQNILLKKKQ